jgi:hypothetical protein
MLKNTETYRSTEALEIDLSRDEFDSLTRLSEMTGVPVNSILQIAVRKHLNAKVPQTHD